MAARIDHIWENGVELKWCSNCKLYRPLINFSSSKGHQWDDLFYICKNCRKSRRTANVQTIAVNCYVSICWRVSNDERYLKKNILVKVTKEDFVKWYENNYFKGCHVDRIENEGNYEISNLQTISHREHNFKRRRDRLNKIGIVEPLGIRYCFTCNTLRLESYFYKKKGKISKINPNGLNEDCKSCSRKKRTNHYRRTGNDI